MEGLGKNTEGESTDAEEVGLAGEGHETPRVSLSPERVTNLNVIMHKETNNNRSKRFDTVMKKD